MNKHFIPLNPYFHAPAALVTGVPGSARRLQTHTHLKHLHTITRNPPLSYPTHPILSQRRVCVASSLHEFGASLK